MVELTFSDEFLRLALKRLLEQVEFFRLGSDQRLRVARKLSGQVLNLILKSSHKTNDSL